MTNGRKRKLIEQMGGGGEGPPLKPPLTRFEEPLGPQTIPSDISQIAWDNWLADHPEYVIAMNDLLGYWILQGETWVWVNGNPYQNDPLSILSPYTGRTRWGPGYPIPGQMTHAVTVMGWTIPVQHGDLDDAGTYWLILTQMAAAWGLESIFEQMSQESQAWVGTQLQQISNELGTELGLSQEGAFGMVLTILGNELFNEELAESAIFAAISKLAAYVATMGTGTTTVIATVIATVGEYVAAALLALFVFTVFEQIGQEIGGEDEFWVAVEDQLRAIRSGQVEIEPWFVPSAGPGAWTPFGHLIGNQILSFQQVLVSIQHVRRQDIDAAWNDFLNAPESAGIVEQGGNAFDLIFAFITHLVNYGPRPVVLPNQPGALDLIQAAGWRLMEVFEDIGVWDALGINQLWDSITEDLLGPFLWSWWPQLSDMINWSTPAAHTIDEIVDTINAYWLSLENESNGLDYYRLPRPHDSPGVDWGQWRPGGPPAN